MIYSSRGTPITKPKSLATVSQTLCQTGLFSPNRNGITTLPPGMIIAYLNDIFSAVFALNSFHGDYVQTSEHLTNLVHPQLEP